MVATVVYTLACASFSCSFNGTKSPPVAKRKRQQPTTSQDRVEAIARQSQDNYKAVHLKTITRQETRTTAARQPREKATQPNTIQPDLPQGNTTRYIQATMQHNTRLHKIRLHTTR